MVYNNFDSLLYKNVSICRMKDLYFVAVLGFQAVSMTSSISLERSNFARDCLIGWLLKVKASEKVGELLTVLMAEKAFLFLKGAEWGDLLDGRAVGYHIGNQCCVVHLGIIMIPMVLSVISFDAAAPTRLKAGNACILWVFRLKLRAFTAMQYESDIQETYLSICFWRRVANRSTCGLNWNLSHKF